jgi:hypothetical protein
MFIVQATGLKGLPITNTLAYYEHSEITTSKSFITLGPVGINYTKLFYFGIQLFGKIS